MHWIERCGICLSNTQTKHSRKNSKILKIQLFLKKVLRGLTIGVNKGQTLALCGESGNDFFLKKSVCLSPIGCGKSTSIGLILRFYQPQQGHVLIDDVDLDDLDIRRWRRRIGSDFFLNDFL